MTPDNNLVGNVKPKQKPLCGLLPRSLPQLSTRVTNDPRRAAAILATQSKWVNGTVLHYCFFTQGVYSVPSVQADVIRDAFAKWKNVGIGLEFLEVDKLEQADARIGYSENIGSSQSAVGRGVLGGHLDEPTTQYGWDLRTPYGQGTALHELGHVLGMEHEHQSPFSGIKWHEQAVYDSLSGPPNNWDSATIEWNILRKLSPQEVTGSTWDPDSIMEYEFEPGLIAEPKQYDQNGLHPPGILSATDKQWALKWYPPLPTHPALLKPLEPVTANLAAGQQVDYAIQPTASRKYTIETRGATDALMVLFEEIDGVPSYLAGDDDSGTDRQAAITQRLIAGRKYIVRLRTIYPGESGKTLTLLT